MIKKIFYIILIAGVLITTCSCALLQKPIDNRTGFSKNLNQLEDYIRNEDWEKAKGSLVESKRIWKKIKPLMQIDIDHDYVNNIEENFIKLDGYVETNEKPDSLATILLVEDIWKNIGTL